MAADAMQADRGFVRVVIQQLRANESEFPGREVAKDDESGDPITSGMLADRVELWAAGAEDADVEQMLGGVVRMAVRLLTVGADQTPE